MSNHTEDLKKLFFETFHKEAGQISLLEASGSARKYYRMLCGDISVMGVFNEDKKENRAFIEFSRHFRNRGINVPEILNEKLDKNIYLIEDLGNQTLYQLLSETRQNADDFPESLLTTYKQALDGLLQIQIYGGEGLDYSLCYPRAAFDRQSIMWDLNYFKYYFLKLAKIGFDEQLLENDFNTLADFLLEADTSFFLYRDFQSRNIMIHNNELFFIDYQGGRKGALQYDVASLLYDGKANIPQPIRNLLLDYYVSQLEKTHATEAQNFKTQYYAFVFVRIMQAMGSYGFRGFYEKKTHFLQSIPYALKNLQWLLENVKLSIEIPTLWQVFQQLTQSKTLKAYSSSPLKISIYSFSFKESLPVDKSGNGGGFVFDCRCLPNPGRYDKYKFLTGKNQEVIDYLNEKTEVNLFYEHVKSIVDMAINNYIERKFQHLMVNFGCTGGQHRSVYFAERLCKYLKNNHSIEVQVYHCMEGKWTIDS
jgi:aminoglycoside/choline kinase family phosphotransferase